MVTEAERIGKLQYIENVGEIPKFLVYNDQCRKSMNVSGNKHIAVEQT